jgi:hypothetical protein
MLKKVDVPQTLSGSGDVEYYKSLARLAEQRARNIRRIAALDREKLEKHSAEREFSGNGYDPEKERLKRACARLQANLDSTGAELKKLRKIHSNMANSRAHRLADTYVRYATGDSLFAWVLQPVRAATYLLLRIWRVLRTQ